MDDIDIVMYFCMFFFIVDADTSLVRRVKRLRTLDGVCTVSETSLASRVLPIILSMVAHTVRGPGREWWKEPRQCTHWQEIEGNAWQTSTKFRDDKYRLAYRMPYAAFRFLVTEIEPWIRPESLVFVREPLPVDMIVGIVVFRLAHGLSARLLADRFGVGASTIRKYVDLVVGVLSDEQKLFSKYISTPHGARLQHITDRFQYVCGLPNVAGSIDGTHIPMETKPSRRDTNVPADFYCARKGFNSVVLQGVCDADLLFWNVCCTMPGGTTDSGALKVSSLYAQLVARSILQEPVVLVRGTRVRPYLLADAGYPSREYMLRNFKPADGNVDKIRFDMQMNAGRVLVENAFGLLKGRWRILKRANCSVLRLPKVAAACCVLHNFCQLMEVGEPCDGVGVCIDLHLGWHGNCLGIVRVAKHPWRARHCASTMI